MKLTSHLPLILLLCGGGLARMRAATPHPGQRQSLAQNWQLQSSFLVKEDGAVVSSTDYRPGKWFPTSVPATVLSALVENGVYPDPRFALNAFRVPDASDEFNEKEKLAQYSHLPGQRNPWTDPWWFRTTFKLSPAAVGTRTWLHFDSINYRAEVWLNGSKVADREEMVSMNQRFAFDVSRWVLAGSNCLAVKIWRVDHVGSPGTQLVPLATNRSGEFSEGRSQKQD